MITAVPSGGAQDEAYVAITSCSGARVPKFDSKLEIQSPEQGGMILLFLTACAVFPCVHCGQSAKTPALVPESLVCYQIWVTSGTRAVIAILTPSWATPESLVPSLSTIVSNIGCLSLQCSWCINEQLCTQLRNWSCILIILFDPSPFTTWGRKNSSTLHTTVLSKGFHKHWFLSLSIAQETSLVPFQFFN